MDSRCDRVVWRNGAIILILNGSIKVVMCHSLEMGCRLSVKGEHALPADLKYTFILINMTSLNPPTATIMEIDCIAGVSPLFIRRRLDPMVAAYH